MKGCKCKVCSCRNKEKESSIGCDCLNCTNTHAKGYEELLDIVDEYLTEVTGESIDIPDETNDIYDRVFGSETLDDENICKEEQSYSLSNIVALGLDVPDVAYTVSVYLKKEYLVKYKK